jgi:hypothetical protein
MPQVGAVDQLTENDVVAAACDYLEASGWSVDVRLSTSQKGDDIEVTRSSDGMRLFVEAKGATSARSNSYRFGQPFESAAVRVHVSEAVFKAAQVLSREVSGSEVRAGIALPANRHHQRLVAMVRPVLASLGVAVLWVDGDRQVAVESSWELPA